LTAGHIVRCDHIRFTFAGNCDGEQSIGSIDGVRKFFV
jgi:hypothetical protein